MAPRWLRVWGALVIAMTMGLTFAGQSVTSQTQSQTPPVPANTPLATEPAATLDPEIIELRAQREEMIRSEDRLFQLIGGALTLLVVVNIAGYVVLGRNYERDRMAIRNEVMAEVRALVDIESARAAAERNKTEQELLRTLNEHAREAVAPFRDQIEKLAVADGRLELSIKHLHDDLKSEENNRRKLEYSVKDIETNQRWYQIKNKFAGRSLSIDDLGVYVSIAEDEMGRDNDEGARRALTGIVNILDGFDPETEKDIDHSLLKRIENLWMGYGMRSNEEYDLMILIRDQLESIASGKRFKFDPDEFPLDRPES